PLRAPHVDEPPAPPPRLHLLPGVLRGRTAHDVDPLRLPLARPSPRLPGHGADQPGCRLDVLRQAVADPPAGAANVAAVLDQQCGGGDLVITIRRILCPT